MEEINSEFESDQFNLQENQTEPTNNQLDPIHQNSSVEDKNEINEESEPSNLMQLMQRAELPSSTADVGEVLGVQFSPTIFDDLELMAQKVSNKVPSWVYAVFLMQILAVSLFILGLSLATTAWATAALIEGINLADQVGQNSWELSAATRKGISKILPMIWMTLIPTVEIFLWGLALLVIVPVSIGIGYSLLEVSLIATMIAAIIAVGAIVVVAIQIIRVILSQTVGQRIVVFESIKFKDAYKKSKQLIKGHKAKMIWLSFSHFLVLDVVLSTIVAAPLVAAVAGAIFSNFE